MRLLYERGVRGFWFTDAQFIPALRYIEDAKELMWAIPAAGMDYFEIGITSGSQELVRRMRKGYNPMSMMPWTARQLLWNTEPMGSTFGRLCLEAFERNPGDFGRTVMDLLERDYGSAPLEEALRAPVEGRRALATAVR
jgi:hypothetical protein